jgi:hypothetical protein
LGASLPFMWALCDAAGEVSIRHLNKQADNLLDATMNHQGGRVG